MTLSDEEMKLVALSIVELYFAEGISELISHDQLLENSVK